jgi:hypothetical protein
MTREDIHAELWREVDAHGEADWRLVRRLIFWEAAGNEPRGFRDAFTDPEILRLASLECVYNHWSKQDRDWLITTADTIQSDTTT